MTAKSFVDTNILLYAVGTDSTGDSKSSRARAVLREPGIGLSAQVLQEFVANALSKKSLRISETKIDGVLRVLEEFPCVPVTPELVRSALVLRTRYQISFWDAAILAAAQSLGCDTVFSEDFNHGQLYGSVRVINPFLAPVSSAT
jgi:predicted nucleic acid-binding protein